MFEVNVRTQRGTHVNDLLCTQRECTLGKDNDCYIVLHGWKVGKRHALIQKKSDGVYIKHIGTTIGLQTLVNGEQINEYGPINEEDEIAIHSYRITVKDKGGQAVPKLSVTDREPDRLANQNSITVDNAPKSSITLAYDAEKNQDAQALSTGKTTPNDIHEVKAEPQLVGRADDHSDKNAHNQLAREWQIKVHDQLIQQMDLRRIDVHTMSDEELEALTKKLLADIVAKLDEFPEQLDKQDLAKRVLTEAIGLGPLEELIARDDISEIMVNAADEIYYETQGKMYKSDIVFSDDRAVIYAIERIVTPLGRRIDESSPMVDARLKDGSRVNAVIPPLSLKGPCITIRKFMKEKLTAEHIINFGSATPEMMVFLENIVKFKQNAIISGGTGSGKTTLLNVLSNYIPGSERIITVEDSAELKLYQANLISLEARPANQEGKGAVAIRDLVKNCLRMRPDRIVVGECRSGEALDMLQAMNTGHDGSLTTVHANSPRDCISRVEVMVLMAGMDLPTLAIREQIASAVNIIVQQSRFSCGTRKITSISEVTGIDGGRVQIGEIFKFVQNGYDEAGKVKGRFVATGLVPKCYGDLRDRGIAVDISIFNREAAGA